MTVIEAICNLWATTQELAALIPADRVIAGPPNPGTPTPCLGFVAEQIASGVRSSTGQYPEITVRFVAQSESADVLEQLPEALRKYLPPFATDRYHCLDLHDIRLEIERPTSGPNVMWVASGELVFTCSSV